MQKKLQPLGTKEFVTLLAAMMSLVALSIDTMLPALPAIGKSMGISDSGDTQMIIALLFFGMAFGQMLFGPISDSFGRKPAIYGGVSIFIGGCLISIFSTQFAVMLGGRFLQGLGAASSRVVSVAMIRDLYKGRTMAKIMSFTMMVFILVPVLAPAIGQVFLTFSTWRSIFWFLLVLALISLIWFAFKQPETLPISRRAEFSWRHLGRAVAETCTNRIAFGYTVTTGFIFGSFIGYLSSAQPIFQVLYGLHDQFPLYFGVLALSFGLAAFINSRLVVRLGMQRLSFTAAIIHAIWSGGFLAITYQQAGFPPLWQFMAYLLVTFFCLGIMFGNLNALAIEPLGHIAGIASSVMSSLQTIFSVIVGTIIGQLYNQTVLPLVMGLAVFGLLAVLAMIWTESARPPQQEVVAPK